jgi:hypothetical protein
LRHGEATGWTNKLLTKAIMSELANAQIIQEAIIDSLFADAWGYRDH